MNKLLVIIIYFLINFSYADEIQIVQSVPLETIYGSTNTKRTQEVWINAISKAKEKIDFEQFYFENKENEALDPIIKEIIKKANEGVKIRFIFDKVMMKATAKNIHLLKNENIKIKIIDLRKISGGIQHSKFFIIDKDEVFIGSQNFDWRSLSHINEIGALIKSKKAALNFQKIFDIDWNISNDKINKNISYKDFKEAINFKNKQKAYINSKEIDYYLAFSPEKLLPYNFNTEIEEILRLINNSEKYIKAQVMTYSDKRKFNEIYTALKKAGERGVKINLIFSDWAMGKNKDSGIKKLSNLKNISIRISSLPQYSKGFIPFARVEHSKFMIVDGNKSIISTSNWGYDYFYQTRGASLIMEGKESAKILEEIFDTSYNSPYVKNLELTKIYEGVKKE